jgi:sigma-B regulation protein RsbU (phosphoserine phosphatase)
MPLLASPTGGEPQWIEGGGPLIGMFDRLDLELERLEIQPGERLVLFTDGITDAAAPSGERFGQDRLRRAIAESCLTGGAAFTCRAVIEGVLGFQGDALPADDLALLVLRRLPA